MNKKFVDRLMDYLWLISFLIGALGTVFIWLNFKTDREAFSLFRYLFYVGIFIFILLGISFFPNTFKHKYLLLAIIFIFYMGYVNPKLNYFAQHQQSEQYYTYENIFLNPLLFFSVCFAYRLGGGTSSECFKTGMTAIILLFSGFLDLMWFVVNNVPYVVDTVSIPHIKVIIGHEPSFMELGIFIFFHIVLLVLINLMPLQKWFDNFSKRRDLNARTLY